jgi:molybdopterin converting factor small subunit
MMVEVQIRLFGAFRKYSACELTLEVPQGTPVRKLRRRVADVLRARCPEFADEALLDLSAFAEEDRILRDTDLVGRGPGTVSVAILPPVCGG